MIIGFQKPTVHFDGANKTSVFCCSFTEKHKVSDMSSEYDQFLCPYSGVVYKTVSADAE